MSNSPGRRIASVGNALRALRALAEAPDGLGVTRLAKQIGIGKSSAHLLLATLADDNFVTQDQDGRYRLGLGAFEVGIMAGGIAAAGGPLTPLLQALADSCGEAVSLAQASGRDAIIVQRIESVSILRAEIQVGTRMPLHASASGKYLLAQLPRERLDALYPANQLPEVAPGTIRSKTALLRQLKAAREQGYARNDEEYTQGVSAVATGVVDANGVTAFALSIAGPTHRFQALDWVGELMNSAKAMSEVLEQLSPVAVPRHLHSPEPRSSGRTRKG